MGGDDPGAENVGQLQAVEESVELALAVLGIRGGQAAHVGRVDRPDGQIQVVCDLANLAHGLCVAGIEMAGAREQVQLDGPEARRGDEGEVTDGI